MAGGRPSTRSAIASATAGPAEKPIHGKKQRKNPGAPGKLRAHMRAELIELHQRLGRTFIYVTHDQLEAMTMSNRIAVMHEGELQQLGAPMEVYERPANLFVAGFIGSPAMNLLRGSLEASGGGLAVACAGLRIEARGGGAGGRSVLLGVRPEDIVIGQGSAHATIRVVEPTGHETIVIAEIGGEQVVLRAPTDAGLTPGVRVPVSLKTARLHAFDASTGERLPLQFEPQHEAAAIR